VLVEAGSERSDTSPTSEADVIPYLALPAEGVGGCERSPGGGGGSKIGPALSRWDHSRSTRLISGLNPFLESSMSEESSRVLAEGLALCKRRRKQAKLATTKLANAQQRAWLQGDKAGFNQLGDAAVASCGDHVKWRRACRALKHLVERKQKAAHA
jgi:hypothetical protein